MFAPSLRLQLWSEHLGLSASDPRLLDPAGAPSLWWQAATEVAEGHLGRARPPQPRGRVLAHRPEPLQGLRPGRPPPGADPAIPLLSPGKAAVAGTAPPAAEDGPAAPGGFGSRDRAGAGEVAARPASSQMGWKRAWKKRR